MIQYFGYGANRDPEMMKAIVGRVPQGTFATVSDFELCIQDWPCLLPKVQEMLTPSWDTNFKSYVLRASTNASTRKVRGMVWNITKEERHMIDNWELTGEWYHVFTLQFGDIQLEIQVIDNQPVEKVVMSPIYKTFLNDKKRMIKTAERARQWYINSTKNN